MATVSDSVLSELIIAAKDAALDLKEVAALAHVPVTGSPKLVRLIRAIQAAERQSGLRAVLVR